MSELEEARKQLADKARLGKTSLYAFEFKPNPDEYSYAKAGCYAEWTRIRTEPPEFLFIHVSQTDKFLGAETPFLSWVVNESPWAQCFITKDLREGHEKGFVLDVNHPVNLLQQAGCAVRSVREYPRIYKMWNTLVNHTSPITALAVALACPNGGFRFIKDQLTSFHTITSSGDAREYTCWIDQDLNPDAIGNFGFKTRPWAGVWNLRGVVPYLKEIQLPEWVFDSSPARPKTWNTFPPSTGVNGKLKEQDMFRFCEDFHNLNYLRDK